MTNQYEAQIIFSVNNRLNWFSKNRSQIITAANKIEAGKIMLENFKKEFGLKLEKKSGFVRTGFDRLSYNDGAKERRPFLEYFSGNKSLVIEANIL